ncbi:MAG TPA: DUF6508 domain-containing protein [Acidimicrobiia bacterium]|nr:DUF6508 domain-containing protein [Acidimicrobiia bacterium]
MKEHETDESLEAALAAAPAELWAELSEAARAFNAETEHTTWSGGDQIGTAVVDGEERPVLQMPYATYTPSVSRIVRLLYDIGVVHPFDWAHWDGEARYRDPAALRTAPVADAARMATGIIRNDRFFEGAIGAACRSGLFGAIVERLLRWYDSERPGAMDATT